MSALPVSIITPNPSLRRQASRALGSGGFDVKSLSAEQPDLDQRLAEPNALIVVDSAVEAAPVIEALSRLDPAQPRPSLLVLTCEIANTELAELLTNSGVNNFVARRKGIDGDEGLDERELLVTARKLVTRDIFGLDKYLSTWGARSHSFDIGSSADKELAVASLDDYLHDIGCYRAIATSIGMVAEELTMNMLFDAPLDAEGQPKYVDVQRDHPLVLEPAEHGKLSYGCSGRYVGLRVTDPFGALTREVIVRYVKAAFLGTPGKMREGSGPGAGLGLFMVFSSATQLVFNVDVGRRTEVIALFYVSGTGRAFRSAGSSLNIFFA